MEIYNLDNFYQRQGEYIFFFKKGQPRLKCNYIDGDIENILLEWDVEGNLISKYTFKDGIQKGEQREYFNKDRIKHIFIFNDKKQIIGEEIFYHNNGNIAQKIFYDKYGRQQTDALYYRNGKLNYYSEYKNNIPHGVYKTFFEDGPLSLLLHKKNEDLFGEIFYTIPRKVIFKRWDKLSFSVTSNTGLQYNDKNNQEENIFSEARNWLLPKSGFDRRREFGLITPILQNLIN